MNDSNIPTLGDLIRQYHNDAPIIQFIEWIQQRLPDKQMINGSFHRDLRNNGVKTVDGIKTLNMSVVTWLLKEYGVFDDAVNTHIEFSNTLTIAKGSGDYKPVMDMLEQMPMFDLYRI